jgi:hypothetical protein
MDPSVHGRSAMHKSIVLLALLVPATASARVRDNSLRDRPANLVPANTDGSSAADWVGVDQVAGYAVNLYAGHSDGGSIWPIPRGSTGLTYQAQPMYTITGHFANTARLDTCVVSQIYISWLSQQVNCYQDAGGAMYEFGRVDGTAIGTMLGVLPVNLATSSKGFAVGDFDGDGYDEVLVYPRFSAGSSYLYRFDRASGRFAESTAVAFGDLTPLLSSGNVDVLSGSFDGLTGDDLLLYHRPSQMVTAVRSRVETAGRAFRQYFPWQSTSFGANHQLSIANVNGDAHDDLVALDTTTGVTQFLWVYRPVAAMTPLQPMQSVNQGNLPLTSGVRQVWATDTIARDTVFTVKDGIVYRYYPAVDGSGQMTYWYSGGWYASFIWSVIKP